MALLTNEPLKERDFSVRARRTTRVAIRLAARVTLRNKAGLPESVMAWTSVVNKNGARFECKQPANVADEVVIVNITTGKSAKGKVVWTSKGPDRNGNHEFAIGLHTPTNLWNIGFPPEDWELAGESRPPDEAGVGPNGDIHGSAIVELIPETQNSTEPDNVTLSEQPAATSIQTEAGPDRSQNAALKVSVATNIGGQNNTEISASISHLNKGVSAGFSPATHDQKDNVNGSGAAPFQDAGDFQIAVEAPECLAEVVPAATLDTFTITPDPSPETKLPAPAGPVLVAPKVNVEPELPQEGAGKVPQPEGVNLTLPSVEVKPPSSTEHSGKSLSNGIAQATEKILARLTEQAQRVVSSQGALLEARSTEVLSQTQKAIADQGNRLMEAGEKNFARAQQDLTRAVETLAGRLVEVRSKVLDHLEGKAKYLILSQTELLETRSGEIVSQSQSTMEAQLRQIADVGDRIQHDAERAAESLSARIGNAQESALARLGQESERVISSQSALLERRSAEVVSQTQSATEEQLRRIAEAGERVQNDAERAAESLSARIGNAQESALAQLGQESERVISSQSALLERRGAEAVSQTQSATEEQLRRIAEAGEQSFGRVQQQSERVVEALSGSLAEAQEKALFLLADQSQRVIASQNAQLEARGAEVVSRSQQAAEEQLRRITEAGEQSFDRARQESDRAVEALSGRLAAAQETALAQVSEQAQRIVSSQNAQLEAHVAEVASRSQQASEAQLRRIAEAGEQGFARVQQESDRAVETLSGRFVDAQEKALARLAEQAQYIFSSQNALLENRATAVVSESHNAMTEQLRQMVAASEQSSIRVQQESERALSATLEKLRENFVLQLPALDEQARQQFRAHAEQTMAETIKATRHELSEQIDEFAEGLAKLEKSLLLTVEQTQQNTVNTLAEVTVRLEEQLQESAKSVFGSYADEFLNSLKNSQNEAVAQIQQKIDSVSEQSLLELRRGIARSLSEVSLAIGGAVEPKKSLAIVEEIDRKQPSHIG